MKSVVPVILLVEIDICSLELEYEICNSRIWEVILIVDSTILLDYGDQFMKSLHIVDSKSWTQTLGISL